MSSATSKNPELLLNGGGPDLSLASASLSTLATEASGPQVAGRLDRPEGQAAGGSSNNAHGSGEEEAARKKKKKNKNKKKGQQAAAAASEACGPRSDNLFDKASTRGDLTSNGGGANPAEEGVDFTPLKDKIGQSFFDD